MPKAGIEVGEPWCPPAQHRVSAVFGELRRQNSFAVLIEGGKNKRVPAKQSCGRDVPQMLDRLNHDQGKNGGATQSNTPPDHKTLATLFGGGNAASSAGEAGGGGWGRAAVD